MLRESTILCNENIIKKIFINQLSDLTAFDKTEETIINDWIT